VTSVRVHTHPAVSILLAWMVLIPGGIAFAQEEDAGTYGEREKKLEWSGNLDAKYALFHLDMRSPFLALQFPGARPSSSYLSQYRLEPYLNAAYRSGDVGFVLKTHATYYSDSDTRVDLFEAYGTYSPSFNTTMQAGKRVYSWGKGYAFNPVGFVNSVKDPENPELAQAGLLSANVEYLKSFQSTALQSIAITAVLIPPAMLPNSRYGEMEGVGLALKGYALLWDTDIEVMTLQSEDKPRSYGLDFARNLQENVEVHGEFSYAQGVQRFSVRDGMLTRGDRDASTYLVGLRFLSASNTTIIAEYFHNDVGLNKGEYEEYSAFVLNGTTSPIAAVLQQTLATQQKYFKGSTLMQEYLYLKVIQPEPFDWLYFTPSVFMIYNLEDKSALLSASLSYKPSTNVEFLLWPTVLVGSPMTEYGGKQLQERVEFWLRVYY